MDAMRDEWAQFSIVVHMAAHHTETFRCDAACARRRIIERVFVHLSHLNLVSTCHHDAIDRLSSIKWGVGYRQRILGVVTYVLVVARTGTPTVPTALGVPYGYAPAVTRVLGPTIAMSVTILKL